MKEQAIQKINQIGKISNIFTLIAKILVGMGLVCTIIGAIICFMIPESLVRVTTGETVAVNVDYSSLGLSISDEERETALAELQKEVMEDQGAYSEVGVTLDNEKMQFQGEMETTSLTMRDAAWAVVIAAVSLVMTFITLCFISALCKAFRDCSSPFEENVIKKMQNLAISLIPWCIISSVADSVLNSIINRKPSISFSVDLGVVLVVLIVLVLVYIFKYGAILQQESDETL